MPIVRDDKPATTHLTLLPLTLSHRDPHSSSPTTNGRRSRYLHTGTTSSGAGDKSNDTELLVLILWTGIPYASLS